MLDTQISPNLKYLPICAVRKDMPLEVIHLELFQKLMQKSPGEVLNFIRLTSSFKQRAASVATSFIVYMACNVGQSYTREALALANTSHFNTNEEAFLAQWAIFNQRRPYGLNIIRPVEVILAKEYIFDKNRINWNNVPNVTQEDIDVIEGMCMWWGSRSGQLFRDKAYHLRELARMEETENIKQAQFT